MCWGERGRTDVPSIEERKYCAYGKDVVELVHNHLDGWRGCSETPGRLCAARVLM